MTALTGNVSGQTLTGPGTWNATGTTTITTPGLLLANGADLENDGVMVLNVPGGGLVNPDGSGAFTNAIGATLTVVTGRIVPNIVNAGTITVSTSLNIEGTFTNTGTISLQSGTLNIGNALTNTGAITTAAGTSLGISGANITGTFNIGGALGVG